MDAPLTDEQALALAELPDDELPALLERAAAVRDRRWGRRLTYSPKVFLPVTNLCRNHCSYCSFRRSPGEPGAWTMSPSEVQEWLARGKEQGCAEALLCLGDKPESAFAAYRRELASWGHESTVDYLEAVARDALRHGLLPHTNAGVLTAQDMTQLKAVNVSLGLMLESASARLCGPGMPHRRAPDKRPEGRLRMLDAAGRLRIAFTTGILLGIGETKRERVEALLAIRAVSRAHGHVQEVIVQTFRAHPGTPMRDAPEPTDAEVAHAVALARLVLDDDVTVQAPPNLNAGATELLVRAGINDFGGISPVTPDYINPAHAWPHVARLGDACARLGFDLAPRLAVHDAWIDRPGFLDETLRGPTLAARERLGAGSVPSAGKVRKGGDEDLLRDTDPPVREALERALEGREVSVEDALLLDAARGPGVRALCAVADALRRAQVGPVATYVVNRNINFTNVCVKACRFCAFSRTQRSEEGYLLDLEEIVRRTIEARDLGATEVCIQAGLAPGMDPGLYAGICRAVKRAAPEMHIHAFSPEEIKYGAGLAGVPFAAFLEELKDAGLGSLPGTSAEILDDTLRARIAPGRIRTAEWIDVVTSAHRLGLPTTSTMMYGHVETSEHRVRHLALLRSLQKDTGGFTEFVPLSFIAEEAPMFKRSLVRDVRRGPPEDEVARVHALARLILGATFRNVQVSWVKEGIDRSIELLGCGANDLGGTLINESISTSAGSKHGQRLSPGTLRRAIRRAGRIPAERDTRYRTLRLFEGDVEHDPHDALDAVPNDGDALGSYGQLTRDPRFRFVRAGAR